MRRGPLKLNKLTASRIIRRMLRISKKQYSKYLNTFRLFNKQSEKQSFGKILQQVKTNQYAYKLTSGQSWLYTIAENVKEEKQKYQNIGKKYPGNKYLRFFKNYRKNISKLRHVASKKVLEINKFISVAPQAFLLLFHYQTILANESCFNLYLHGVDGDLSWRYVYNMIHVAVVRYDKEIIPEYDDIGALYGQSMESDYNDFSDIDIDKERVEPVAAKFIPLYPDDEYPYKTYRGPETLLNRHLFILQRKFQLDYEKKDIKNL